MLQVPLNPVPSQTLAISLDGQNVNITLRTQATGLYLTMLFNGAPLTTEIRCLNMARLLADRQYLGFVGDLLFVDTQEGIRDPDYTGLGSRYQLIYLEASDIAELL